LVALTVVVEIGDVQKAVDDAVACIGIGGGKGCDVGRDSLLICYVGRESRKIADDCRRNRTCAAPYWIAE
jgi:hypothetical protein